MSQRARSRSSLERRKESLRLHPTILIVCEGKETEPRYFQALRRELRLTAAQVKIYDRRHGTAAINIVNCAIDELNQTKVGKSEKYDSVWCVFDVEIPVDSTLKQALQNAQAYGIDVALTNPCFEYWYILHFEKMARYFQTTDEVKKTLKTHLPNYTASDAGTFGKVYPYTESACERAEQVIIEKCYGNDLSNCNPSTHVQLLVEYLREVSQLRKYPKSS